MEKGEMLSLVQADLKNEYTHMLFYLASSSTLRGLDRVELGEWLEEEAKSEMEHVKAFSKIIVSLGGTPVTSFWTFPVLTSAAEIVNEAIKLEQEVCDNYARRLDEIDAMLHNGSGFSNQEHTAWRRVALFYEEQLMHSHKDLDEMRQWID